MEENDLHSEHAVDEKENEEAADALHPVGNVEVVGQDHKIQLQEMETLHLLDAAEVPAIPKLIDPLVNCEEHVPAYNDDKQIPAQVDDVHERWEVAHDYQDQDIVHI